MKNPLFYLSAFAVCLFCATPAKAKNPTPDFSEETVTDEKINNTSPANPSPYKGEGSVDASQRGGEVKATNATSDQMNHDLLSLEERLKSLPINEASRADLRQRLIEYREAIKSRKTLSSLQEKEGELGLPDEVKSQDSNWRQRLKATRSTDNVAADLAQKTQPKPETPTPEVKSELQKKTKDFSTFPVGLSVGKRNVKPSVIIRGQEDGTQAINFENWLLPFDDVIQALKLDLKNLPDGQLEVRSPGLVTRIDPKKLRNDPELGLVFSIQDLNTLFGIKAQFNINDYAIELDVPWLNQSGSRIGQAEPPIILEGIPRIAPGNFSFGAIEQKLNASGSEGTSASYRGDFLAVGSIFGGSWFVRTDQPNFQDASTWRLAEAQFYRPNDQADYIFGSQPTFWRSQGVSDYWGFTYIQRQGFTPPQLFGGGFVDPRLRLQASQIGRTITGTAQPGTLVRLAEAFGDRVIGEVLVDSSGIYRFENVRSENQYYGSSYRVLLYPEGRLTAQPEIREATYSIVPGQLPAGSSALVFSGGLRRELNNSLLGNFSDFRGGVAQRWGLSENLTVGVGGVYDDSARGLAELFYRPSNLPLEVAVSALSGSKWDVNADIRFNPTRSLSASFTKYSFSNRFNIDWRVFPGLSLFATTDSRDATGGGVQLNFSGRNAFTFARISLDTENRLRWTLLQRLGRLELNQRGNEIGTLSEFTYNFS
ncbi:hypothetical protein NIES4075_41210 [Tolypothrix sp. NIES-4075]|uniref:hypothetical protein n=1 Tax=Tolypothrix sp. NIES-4075 TaxID=2005459 RepID=UPI000B73A4C5|nr:hypothetical protein [Tolypothrix sp. NIES-4075]GAX43109.1 hypothetical protein NIES4075_41210 [Tolypothrix sp. NIES-4075]